MKFFLLFSPRLLFLLPGLALVALGSVAAVGGYAGVHLGRAGLDVHTLLFGALMIIAGYQGVIFAILTKVFAINASLLPADVRMQRFAKLVSLERGLLTGTVLVLVGLVLLVRTIVLWAERDFGSLDYPRTLRIAIPGVLATVVGLQTIFFVFFAGVLQLDRRPPAAS